MADIKSLADILVGLIVKEVQELAKVLKDEHGIEPAARGAVRDPRRRLGPSGALGDHAVRRHGGAVRAGVTASADRCASRALARPRCDLLPRQAGRSQ